MKGAAMYKEQYVLRKILEPERMGRPGKHYSVTHLTPADGGLYLICAGTRYFETLEEAETYKSESEAKIKERTDLMTEKASKNKMSEAAREARNAYKRKWAAANPDKVKAATRRYWERKAQEITAKEV